MAPIQSTPHEVLVQLHEQISQTFSDQELRGLCFSLGIEYEDLPGPSKTAKARELVTYVERRGQTRKLIAECARLRQNVDWPQAGAPAPAPVRPAESEDDPALRMAMRSLEILERQAAAYTALTIPAHLQIELEEKRRQVAELRARRK